MSKIIDIKQEVINNRSGVHHIRKDNKRTLKNRLKELREEDLFNKHDMSYTWRETEDYILLLIHKSFRYMIG